MTTSKFVAYYRVSTERQGRSGLGLEAQKEAVRQYLAAGGWPPVEEYTEVETGKGANTLDRRPQLQAAIAACKRHKAVLVIAKLDRLARNVHFITGLLEAGVTFHAADMPQADKTMLQIYAVMAEAEADRISARTKAALAAAQARGTVLGANGQQLARQHKAAALERAQALGPTVRDLRAKGFGIRKVADELNRLSIPSPGGTKWHPTSAAKLIKRLEAAG
jgi:DNA invertase Pin-like site-specific DNA recombinase